MQFDERKPDRTETLKVAGYDIYIDTFGSGDEVLFCLNGGPGLPCDYLREPHAPLADLGYRVVAFDQLGCGRSDKPQDRSLWTIERYVEEVETVRTALGLGQVQQHRGPADGHGFALRGPVRCGGEAGALDVDAAHVLQQPALDAGDARRGRIARTHVLEGFDGRDRPHRGGVHGVCPFVDQRTDRAKRLSP